jgi:hypothetical protein
MTPTKLRRLIERLKKQDPTMSQVQLAELIGRSGRAMRDWLAGKNPIPGPENILFEALWDGKVTLDDIDKARGQR